MATAEKKPNPNALKPKQNLLVIGGIMLALGGAWFLWEGVLRPETDDEAKERKEKEKEERQKALQKHGWIYIGNDRRES